MKSRGIVGQKIVKILNRQAAFDDQRGGRYYYVSGIILENGTLLVPRTIETGDGYATEFTIYKKGEWDPKRWER